MVRRGLEISALSFLFELGSSCFGMLGLDEFEVLLVGVFLCGSFVGAFVMWLLGLRTNRVQASAKAKAHSKECQTRQIAGAARSELEDREFLIFPHSGERIHLRTCVHVRSKRGRVTRIIKSCEDCKPFGP